MSKKEMVLVFPATLLEKCPAIVGNFSHQANAFGRIIFNSGECCFRDRDSVENDPSWKQIIPYMAFRHVDEFSNERYLIYKRGGKGGESRLHDLCSLGIGGHIKNSDGTTPLEAFFGGMRREYREEIELDAVWAPQQEPAGIIFDDSNDVGKVHFGFVYVFDCKSEFVKTPDESVIEPEFESVGVLRSIKDYFETWSQIVIDNVL